MNWNWDHLRFFLALADHGTLSLAARELDVSHTTVLRRVRIFEQQLQTHLFDHTPNGYCLTAAGDALYVEAIKMKSAIDGISREISGDDARLEGSVVITATDTLGLHVLPPLLRELQILYPGLALTLNVANRLSDIGNREADIALRTGSEPPAGLIGREICNLRFVACASRDYVERTGIDRFPDDTRSHAFVQLDESYRNLAFHRHLAALVDSRATCTTASGFIYALALCRAGIGITCLPSYLATGDNGLVVLPMPSDIETNPLWILSHADLRDSARVRVVRQFLFAQLRESLDGDG